MKNITRILILIIASLAVLDSVSAQGTSSAVQTVTFSVQRLVRVSVAPLRAESAEIEDSHVAATTSLIVEDDGLTPKKMTLALNAPVKTSRPLEVHFSTSSSVPATYLLTSVASEIPADGQVDLHYRMPNNTSSARATEQSVIVTVTD